MFQSPIRDSPTSHLNTISLIVVAMLFQSPIRDSPTSHFFLLIAALGITMFQSPIRDSPTSHLRACHSASVRKCFNRLSAIHRLRTAVVDSYGARPKMFQSPIRDSPTSHANVARATCPSSGFNRLSAIHRLRTRAIAEATEAIKNVSIAYPRFTDFARH